MTSTSLGAQIQVTTRPGVVRGDGPCQQGEMKFSSNTNASGILPSSMLNAQILAEEMSTRSYHAGKNLFLRGFKFKRNDLFCINKKPTDKV